MTPVSDRDLLIGLLNLVGATAHRLTGEVPVLRLDFTAPDGRPASVQIRPDISHVSWLPAGQPADRDHDPDDAA